MVSLASAQLEEQVKVYCPAVVGLPPLSVTAREPGLLEVSEWMVTARSPGEPVTAAMSRVTLCRV